MIDRTANLLGAVGLAVADRIEAIARAVLKHSGETPAALVVIGYGLGPSNDDLRRILQLSHSGTVRLVDRLVFDGLVERRQGRDKRAIALHLSECGAALREDLLSLRMGALRSMLLPLSEQEQAILGGLLERILPALAATDNDRCTTCRLCDDRVCFDCPIPANFKKLLPAN